MRKLVRPVDEQIFGRTLEDRLANKFDDLQIAREDHQPDLFDEIAKSIEVLLKALPDAFNELMYEKSELDKDLEEETKFIGRQASMAVDDIDRQAIYQSRGFKAMWEYREVYEEVIMEVLQKYHLIPVRKPQQSSIERPEFSPLPLSQQMPPMQQTQMQPLQSPPVQPPSNVPIPSAPSDNLKGRKKKPKLSFKKKDNFNF